NSYFINADKKTIVETAKETFRDVYLSKVKQVCNPEEIEYIVCNHTEPDHSGNVKHLLELAPNATVVGSGQALNYLGEIVGKPFKSLKVKDGDIIDLGNKKLRIIGAPNLHWPDSIYTYLEEDMVLFTCDSFGAHFCSEAMFDDLAGNYDKAFKYYFDVILKPFSKFMLKAIDKIRPLTISVICPGHGPILRENWKKYVDLSEQYAREYLNETKASSNRVFLAYISAYGYTREMAGQIEEGLKAAGDLHVESMDIENALLGDIEERISRSDAIIIGSPTINQNTLLPIYKMFSVLNPIRDKGKLAAAFGSYGWSGEAVKLIEDHLKNLKFQIAVDGLSEKFYPFNGKSDRFFDFGKQFGTLLLEKQSNE
ncbi:MAG TPA: FprA family A-type flavoprotein, partial [Bacteroidales bacterium]|nr:FprA family A-type flavoprotein [Bacteroidales bacterium]